MIATVQRQGNGWTPARYAPPPAPYTPPAQKSMGSAQLGASLESFFADPTLAFVTSLVAAAASGYLGYGLNVMREKSIAMVQQGKISAAQVPGTTWSTFWWILATAMGVKALHDLSKIQ